MTMSTTQEKLHNARLRRGRRMWDLVCRTHYGAMERFGGPLWDMTVRQLNLRAGESVLDIGCGTGAVFGAVREAIGPDGRVVGVDYSPQMIARARRRVRKQGWPNTEIRRADATRTPLGHEEFDAAIALCSFSAMPDVRAAVGHAHNALRPGGRLFLFDLRLVPWGRATKRIKIKMMRQLYRAVVGFTGEDVLAELRRTFATVELVAPAAETKTTFTIALATKSDRA